MMFQRRTESLDSGVEYSSHWISYSDLMAGLLCVFVLLLVVTAYRLGEPFKEVKESLEARQKIVKTLNEEFFGDDRVRVAESGAVSMKGGVLFKPRSAALSDSGKAVLLDVVPRYIDVVQGNRQILEKLHRVRIEGHADLSPPPGSERGSVAAYLYNLRLSQRRATSVVRFLLSADSLSAHRDFMTKNFAASGRSSADPVRDEITGIPDDDSSRRIQIDLVLKDQELIDELLMKLSALGLGDRPNP